MKKDTSNLKKLVIVESPAKSKTIGKILGGDYIVTASVGHIRDLPVNSLGIKISDDGLKFTPVYEVSETKKKVVAGLVKSAKECGEIFLASDPDREGEAIAWHLKAVIDGASKTPVAGRKFHRVRYNEITPAAVRRAFENPGEIDDRVVDAQQARRVLDRLVGYKISRILWRKIRTGISAGRVQSVGLRLVCGREREVRAFTPVPYWEFDVALSKLTGETRPFKARLTQINGKKADVNDEARAAEVKAALEASACEVVSVSEQRRARKPFAPFITSTLQQSASNALGYSPNITMSIAQKLYEGVDLGGELGQTGLITYMRTDSFNVSQEARAAARDFITGAYGAEYHQDKERVYKSRDNAQGAHEAIRPTDPALTPESLAKKLSPQELKLYDLIWRRFVASRMSDAVSNVRTVKIASKASGAPALTLSASSSEQIFAGFTKVYGAVATAEPKGEGDEKESGDAQEMQAWLPPLAEGEALARGAVAAERKETKPPPRFNDASLVKELEANGVGRPS
ncbi:MAG: type I DNA topoisomerase, partial [Kiritimatiellaeota bacterium]|nr:type I DNA topoisomerase [Kiritimatiellota bacterium]